MQIEWTDEDPVTGDKRSVRAERFARAWNFKVRFRRYETWAPVAHPSLDMWETLLDALERRYPRREGVTDQDLKQVRAIVAAWKPLPAVGDKAPNNRDDARDAEST
ncbi:MAG TPA: hypothetical protein VGE74_03755 [Gemmata sp.]